MVLFPDDPVLPRSHINTRTAPGVQIATIKIVLHLPTPGTIHRVLAHGSRPFAQFPYHYGMPNRASITMPMAY
jgi:hypothetical protein